MRAIHYQLAMLWVFLGLTAHLLWAVGNIVDKYVIGNRIKDPRSYMVLFMLAQGLVVFFIPFFDFRLPVNIPLLLFAGICFFSTGFFYYKAVKLEEITRINVLWSLIAVFSLLIGYLFFGERLTGMQGFAFAILVLGSVIAGLHAKRQSLSFTKGFWYMILATFGYGIYATILHHLIPEVGFRSTIVSMFAIQFLIAIIMLVVMRSFRDGFASEMRRMKNKTFILIGMNVVIVSLGSYFSQWALSYTPASLVFSLEGSQAIFVFIIAYFLTQIKKKSLGEEFDRSNVMLKIVAIVLMVVGFTLLSFS